MFVRVCVEDVTSVLLDLAFGDLQRSILLLGCFQIDLA